MLFRADSYRRLIACLAIALQVLGAAVSGLGHVHYGEAACCQEAICSLETTAHNHGGTCSHSHEHAAQSPEPAGDQKLPEAPHDDCSLCRHVSQPVSPVTLSVEIPRSGFAYSLNVLPVEQIAAAVPATHPARGPPAACA